MKDGADCLTSNASVQADSHAVSALPLRRAWRLAQRGGKRGRDRIRDVERPLVGPAFFDAGKRIPRGLAMQLGDLKSRSTPA